MLSRRRARKSPGAFRGQPLLVRDPIREVQIGRRHRHHELGPLVFAHLDQPGERMRRQCAQSRQKGLILRSFSSDQKVDRDFPGAFCLPGAETLGPSPGRGSISSYFCSKSIPAASPIIMA